VTAVDPSTLPRAPSTEDLGPLRPSSFWYWLAGIIGIGGVIGGIVFSVLTITDTIDQVDDWPRVDVPGSAEFQLDDGEYTLFLEYPGANDNYFYENPPDVEITSPSNVSLPIVPRRYGTTTYSWSGHEGESFGRFQAPETGTYRIEVTSEPEPFQQVAVGHDITGRVVLRVFGGLAIAGIAVILSLILVIVTAVRRGREKRRRRPPMAWVSGGPPPGGYPSSGYPPPGTYAPPPGAWPPPYGTPPYPGTGSYPPPPGAYPPPPGGYPPPPGAYPAPPGGAPSPPPGAWAPSAPGAPGAPGAAGPPEASDPPRPSDPEPSSA
jgi:hypothetical protein